MINPILYTLNGRYYLANLPHCKDKEISKWEYDAYNTMDRKTNKSPNTRIDIEEHNRKLIHR